MTRAIRSAYGLRCPICLARAAPASLICVSPSVPPWATRAPIRRRRRHRRKLPRGPLRIWAVRSNRSTTCLSVIRRICGPRSSTLAWARGCAHSSKHSAICSIQRLPRCSMRHSLRTCATTTKRCSSDTHSATRFERFSKATISCCRRCCRSRPLDAGKIIPDQLPDRSLVSWVYYTYPFNLTGQPAATVCAGIAGDGMPVGLQIVGRSLSEIRCGQSRRRIRAHETDGLQSARFCDVRCQDGMRLGQRYRAVCRCP